MRESKKSSELTSLLLINRHLIKKINNGIIKDIEDCFKYCAKDLNVSSKKNIQNNLNECTNDCFEDTRDNNNYQSRPLRFPSEEYDELEDYLESFERKAARAYANEIIRQLCKYSSLIMSFFAIHSVSKTVVLYIFAVIDIVVIVFDIKDIKDTRDIKDIKDIQVIKDKSG